MANKVTSWSYSRYAAYKQCPLKFYLANIAKIAEPPNQAMERGSEIHKLAEDYINGKLAKMPLELGKFAKMFRQLKKVRKKVSSGMAVEDTWAFTKDWTETQWNDWTRCWARIKLDCAVYENEDTLIINDWKTGKFRPQQNADYVEQLELYALGALLLYEDIGVVKPRLVYLDEGTVFPAPGSPEEKSLTFRRSDIDRLKKLWEKRVKPMFLDESFAPRLNNLCRWCFYRKDNAANGGGQCEY